jgi:type IV secretion system protein VirD4
MDLDEVILVIDAQMPIRARRVKYFEDPALKVLHAGQAGSFPYPDEDGLRRDRQMSETRETVERLKQELQEVRAANVVREVGKNVPNTLTTGPVSSGKARGRSARAAASGGGQGQLSIDFAALGVSGKDRTALESAVQTTRSLLAEYADDLHKADSPTPSTSS